MHAPRDAELTRDLLPEEPPGPEGKSSHYHRQNEAEQRRERYDQESKFF